MMTTQAKTSTELHADHDKAMEAVRRLQTERDALPGRLQEVSQADARRRLQGEEGSSESAALVRRRDELPYDLHAAKIEAARLELERVHAAKREARSRYEELKPSVENARIAFEDAKEFYEGLKAEQDSHASRGYMLDYDLRRANDGLAAVEANSPSG